MKAASRSLKKLSFELYGKNPNIIFADSDLDEGVETTIKSSFINQGAGDSFTARFAHIGQVSVHF
jgi:aminomuconate-semialdehyde/2-hydroxymuconate-6-semialdehyde dehydrogenase